MENNEMDLEYIIKMSENLDDENFIKLLKQMSEIYSGIKFKDLEDFFINSNLENKTKASFLLRALNTNTNDNQGKSFYFEILPYLMETCIQKNEDEFISLVTQDTNMQELLVGYIKKYPISSTVIWHRVYELPIVKEQILNDEEFITSSYRKEGTFFEHLPKEYGYLVCFYDTRLDEMDLKYIQFLYKKYFGELLNEEELRQLIKWQYELKAKNEMGIKPKDMMRPLEYGLKKLLEDNSFLEEAHTLEEKAKINLPEIMQICFNYRNTKLYEELVNYVKINDINDDLQAKLKYISQGRKIARINSLAELDNTTLEELQDMEREHVYLSELSLRGGPNSRTSVTVFPDSSEREARRINQDGTMEIELVDRFERHEEAIQRLYQRDVSFPYGYTTVFLRSLEAVKQTSSVTLVIELEQCHIYLPSTLTNKQKEKCLEVIDSAKSKGMFGIVVYNVEEGKFYIDNEDLVDKDQTIKIITKLDSKEQDNENLENDQMHTEEQNEIDDIEI